MRRSAPAARRGCHRGPRVCWRALRADPACATEALVCPLCPDRSGFSTEPTDRAGDRRSSPLAYHSLRQTAMSTLKNIVKSHPLFKHLYRNLNNQYERDDFVLTELKKIPANKLILDAGCGNQRYRQYCSHLSYRAQDFGQYSTDSKKMIGRDGVGGEEGYQYGALDYVGNIWDIKEQDDTFDAILCTEVFEHIPYPIETMREFGRL